MTTVSRRAAIVAVTAAPLTSQARHYFYPARTPAGDTRLASGNTMYVLRAPLVEAACIAVAIQFLAHATPCRMACI